MPVGLKKRSFFLRFCLTAFCGPFQESRGHALKWAPDIRKWTPGALHESGDHIFLISCRDHPLQSILRGRKKPCYKGGMEKDNELESMKGDELLRRLDDLVNKSRCVEADVVAHIAVVDERKLYVKKGFSSMFTYCTKVLHFSEAVTNLRIHVARASRKHPVLLEMLGDGRLHLTAIAKLAPHLTEANIKTFLNRAVHKSKREIEELVAELSPKPDVPVKIRKLPKRREKIQPSSSSVSDGSSRDYTGEDKLPMTPSLEALPVPTPAPSTQLRPDAVAPQTVPAPKQREVMTPLSPERYLVKFTADTELHDNLERLHEVMRSSAPDVDLVAVIAEAVAEKLEREESRRFAKTKSPRKSLEETDTSGSSRYIPNAVKRVVCERDEYQCTFVGDNGHRCTERSGLHFHHDEPYARGGDCRPENIHLMCSPHNQYLAELDYGKEVMERHRRSRDRVKEPGVVYHVGKGGAGGRRVDGAGSIPAGPGPP